MRLPCIRFQQSASSTYQLSRWISWHEERPQGAQDSSVARVPKAEGLPKSEAGAQAPCGSTMTHTSSSGEQWYQLVSRRFEVPTECSYQYLAAAGIVQAPPCGCGISRWPWKLQAQGGGCCGSSASARSRVLLAHLSCRGIPIWFFERHSSLSHQSLLDIVLHVWGGRVCLETPRPDGLHSVSPAGERAGSRGTACAGSGLTTLSIRLIG